MRYKVIEAFIDKNTGEFFPVESHYETADKQRAEELIERGFIEEKTPPAKSTSEPKKSGETKTKAIENQTGE